jgi:hypothetical protein
MGFRAPIPSQRFDVILARLDAGKSEEAAVVGPKRSDPHRVKSALESDRESKHNHQDILDRLPIPVGYFAFDDAQRGQPERDRRIW